VFLITLTDKQFSSHFHGRIFIGCGLVHLPKDNTPYYRLFKMKILFLTRCKEMFVRKDTRSIEDYVQKDLFFRGMRDALAQKGHAVELIGSDSYFFNSQRAYRFRFLYKVFWKISRRTGFFKYDRKRFSKHIAQVINANGIEVLFTEANYNIDPDIIRSLSPKVKITQWFGILPDQLNADQVGIVNKYDHHFCPVAYDDWLEEYGIDSSKFVYMSSGCLSTDEIYFEQDDNHSYDVCFVGGVGGIHENRIEILEHIATHIPSFAYYGYGEKNIPDGYALKNKFKGWVDHNTMRKIFSSSKIAINISTVNYDKITKGFNIRLIEIPGCKGALQICSYHKNLEEFFKEDEEIVLFNSKEELLEKIRFILRHEPVRKQIVDQAYEKAMDHSYENKIGRIISVMES